MGKIYTYSIMFQKVSILGSCIIFFDRKSGFSKKEQSNSSLNPILPGLLNTLRAWGGRIYPPPNSPVFYPRSIKFGMLRLPGIIF